VGLIREEYPGKVEEAKEVEVSSDSTCGLRAVGEYRRISCSEA